MAWLNSLSRLWSVSHLRPHHPEAGVAWIEIGLLLRLVLTAGVLALALHHGLLDGLCAFAGLWGMRWWMIHRIQHTRAFE